jgi:signal transduction histidine kinase
MQQVLEEAGYRVFTAKDGIEAFQLVRETHADLVLTDVVMPNVDGYELVRRLRTDPEVAGTRVIFLSSVYDEQAARLLAKECGVLAMLPKSAIKATILQTVHQAMASPATPSSAPSPDFTHEHRNLLIDKLAEKVAELEKEIEAKDRAEKIALKLSLELQKRADELELRVAERTAEFERAKKRAEAADRLKSVFLATMSHELRTPPNSIIGFSGILLQELPGPLNDEQKKQIGIVQNAARHLLALINDILDISKIESDQIELSLTQFDLPTSIKNVVESVQPQACEKGLALSTQIKPQVGLVYSDRRRFEQILLNLLSNAIKFTDKGHVTVIAQATAEPFQKAEIGSSKEVPASTVAPSDRPSASVLLY